MLAMTCKRSLRGVRSFTFYYSKDHEWVNYDKASKKGLIGITDYAQSQLGDVIHLELPKLNAKYGFGDTLGAVECVKTVADIYSPLSGTVLEVNDSLNSTPELVNESPEDKGWMVKMTVDKPEELESLMNKQQYLKFISAIVH